MTDYARQLLVQCLMEQCDDRAMAERTVDAIMGAQIAAGMLEARHLEAWERDAHVYHLRGKRVTVTVIALRVGLSERKVYDAVRRHQQRRRAALAA